MTRDERELLVEQVAGAHRARDPFRRLKPQPAFFDRLLKRKKTHSEGERRAPGKEHGASQPASGFAKRIVHPQTKLGF